jgi:pimeloyl-ACP methyl ester carboxylesterase
LEPAGPTLAPGAGVVDNPGVPSATSNTVEPGTERPDEPLMEELIDALGGGRETGGSEPPVGSDAVMARRSPVEAPDAGDHSLSSAESVKLVADDGAQIHCTWYPSPRAADNGKNVVPVIIVHGWGEGRSLYDGLARSLQSQGHAVIVPDLRGHGGSTVILTPVENRELRVAVQGDTMKVSGKKMPPSDALTAMVRYDLEAVKDFLTARNNAGELNIQLLCLVASEEGSIVALNWAAADWSWFQPAMMPPGSHVKAVALVSPAMVFQGVNLQRTLANHAIRDRLAVVIIFGEENTTANREARRLYMAFNRARPTVPSRDKIRKRDLVLMDVKSNQQGAELIDVDAFEVDKKIASFIHMRVVNRSRMHPWTAR